MARRYGSPLASSRSACALRAVDRDAMDRTDYAEPTDATPETDPGVASPFVPRLRRAVVMLMAAIATHLWLIRAPVSEAPLSGLPSDRSPIIAQSGLAVPPGSASSREPRKTTPVTVRVRTQFITLSPTNRAPVDRGVRPPTLRERPVGTSGLIRARIEKPVDEYPVAAAPAAAPPSPMQPVDFGDRRTGEADVSARVERPEPDAPAVTRAKPGALGDGAAAVLERAAESGTATDLKKADLTAQEEIVRRVLLDYKRAYDQLDVQAAKAIWPSVDDRALQRAFRQLDGQELRFAKCGVSVTGQDANARCQGEATYRPKVGSRVHLTEREWTFSLARANDRWQIVKASLQ